MRKGNHSEYITFDVVPLGKHAIIIGMPWLQAHNPHMDWEKCKVSFESEFCKENCITITNKKDLEELEIMEISAIGKEEMDIVLLELHSRLPGFDIEKARAMPETRKPYNFTIQLKEGKELPRFAKPYWLTPAQMEEAKKQIEELERCRMISPSKSCIGAPLFFVPKKDGTQRMCIDYRALNDITVKDAYPLPNMEALLESARGATVFSKLDLRSAYNMIPIEPEDRWKTAFITPWGLYQFNVLHYGFSNAPACLQRYMDHILADLIQQQPAKVACYMDDIGIFAKDKEEAIALCKKVLDKLIEVKLYCKASKCEFFKDEIKLLGVTVNKHGFGLEDTKVTDVRNWPIPTNLKSLKGFIGFCNFYRRFLKNFSLIARPLHELDKKGVEWKWEKEQQKAFDKLKEAILSEPCLAHASLDKTFRMETDASAYAYGAALSQKQDDGKFHPVGFMSKSMLPAERNYDAYDWEALGIVKPLEHWRYWLQGTKKPIEIITDHKNLLNEFNNRPTPSKRHLRWLEILKHYNYVVGYCPGAKNTVADILSRREDHYPVEGLPEEFNPFPEDKMIPIEQLELAALELGLEEEEWSQALEWAYLCLVDSDMTIIDEIKSIAGESDPMRQDGRIYVPDQNDLRRQLLELYHDTPITGHLGITGTTEIVS